MLGSQTIASQLMLGKGIQIVGKKEALFGKQRENRGFVIFDRLNMHQRERLCG